MQDPKFPIPPEFQSQLKNVKPLDDRPDAAIRASFKGNVPVSSEKNIWTFWHAGFDDMPPWCQRNVIDWARLCGPTWTVRVLDNIPDSPNNALTWLDPKLLPEAFVKGTMDGPYTGPHSADFLRGAALYTYGGVWMDVGIILVRKLDDVCWRQLEDPASPFEIAVPVMYTQHIANHFVASRKGNAFIKNWHDVFIHLWNNKTNCTTIVQDPLVAFAQNLDFSAAQKRGFHWDFKVDPLVVFGYIGQVLAWLRVALIEDPHTGFNGREYFVKHVLLFDSLTEDWAAEMVIGFNGSDLYDALATPIDGDRNSEQWQKAYKMTWRILTNSTMQKITHGKNLTKGEALGVIWDKPENLDKDIAPGTFAELLRYGSVHFEQTRSTIDYYPAEKSEQKITKGLLEP